MTIGAAERDQFAGLVARLTRAGQGPIALAGAGRTARDLRPGLLAGRGMILGVIDDDERTHGRTIDGLDVIPFEEALRRGAKSAIITATGAAQDALWARRGRFREAGLYLLTCPARFASKPWDDALIDQYEHAMAVEAGLSPVYLHEYPSESAPKPVEMIEAVLAGCPADAAVCEVGAGTGLCTRWIIERAREYHIVDFSERLLYEAVEHRFARHGGALRLHHDESARLAGVPDGSIEIVFSHDVFVHFKSDLVHQFLEAIERVLTPRGRAVLHFARWNEAAIESWSGRQRAAHVGTHSTIFYNHPEWLDASARRLGLAFRLAHEVNGWQFIAEFARAGGR
jgi:SAM-dependent methyltransferase